LHNEGGILVALFGQGIELSNSIIEGLLGEMASPEKEKNVHLGTGKYAYGEEASPIGGVEDLVVEDGEVEGKTEANGVCWGEFGDGNI